MIETTQCDEFQPAQEWFCVLNVSLSECGDISGRYVLVLENLRSIAEALEVAHHQNSHAKWQSSENEHCPKCNLNKVNVQGKKGLGPFANARKVLWMDYKEVSKENWQVDLLTSLAMTM
jgi:hypothetical protein